LNAYFGVSIPEFGSLDQVIGNRYLLVQIRFGMISHIHQRSRAYDSSKALPQLHGTVSPRIQVPFLVQIARI
jgi:hypothetical protein